MEENQEDSKKFKCLQCIFSTNHQSSLVAHVKGVHEKIKPHQCPKCHYSSARAHALKVHMQTHYRNEQLRFECTNCSFTTAIKHKLSAHIGSVHKKKQLLHCPECDYSSVIKSNMKDHILGKGLLYRWTEESVDIFWNNYYWGGGGKLHPKLHAGNGSFII